MAEVVEAVDVKEATEAADLAEVTEAVDVKEATETADVAEGIVSSEMETDSDPAALDTVQPQDGDQDD